MRGAATLATWKCLLTVLGTPVTQHMDSSAFSRRLNKKNYSVLRAYLGQAAG